jgi:3-hydroxyisobutyrate dehydrogenase-like beta-hydroxyacid dehydrogenase
MARILVLHPGAMGAAVGQALREAGHDVGWIAAGRTAATAERAAAAGLSAWSSVHDTDVVLSLVPPVAAVATARSVAGFGGLYIDANAISPARAAEVTQIVQEGGAAYADASIVGPPPREAGTTRLFLSGAVASHARELFTMTRLEPVVIPDREFGASAVKMAYAAWTKISAALLLAADETARDWGVGDELRAEWHRSQPDIEHRYARARHAAEAKGWRWADEMRQIAETFADAGMPGGFGDAAATVYDRYRRP